MTEAAAAVLSFGFTDLHLHLHGWVVWADEAEQERLRQYHQRPIGDDLRHRWMEAPLLSRTNEDIIQTNQERKAHGNYSETENDFWG